MNDAESPWTLPPLEEPSNSVVRMEDFLAYMREHKYGAVIGDGGDQGFFLRLRVDAKHRAWGGTASRSATPQSVAGAAV